MGRSILPWNKLNLSLMAASGMATILMVIALFTQKYAISGLAAGATKG